MPRPPEAAERKRHEGAVGRAHAGAEQNHSVARVGQRLRDVFEIRGFKRCLGPRKRLNENVTKALSEELMRGPSRTTALLASDSAFVTFSRSEASRDASAPGSG